MGKTRSMGSGRCTPIGLPRPRRSLFRPLSVGERGLQRKRLAALSRMKNTLGSKVSLPNQSDKSLKRTDQTTLVSGTDIQGKLSSDVVASTSKPQTSSSSLVGMKKTLGSQASLLRCSACMQIIQSDKSLKGSSDQDQTTLVSHIDIQDQTTLVSLIDIQEKLSSDIVSSTSKPHQGKHLRSNSKIHKPKALLKKKKKSSRKAVSAT
ncbi:uncharacterized protein LOC106402936 isoform X1 [Brassica napus]|uniref:uncharacterized protein LOC106402936 isoform X1 n=1 Tax=Brassica napus TaxID=3708 RepID=UPI002078A247|nr:uncharacterized protein LOC106402936 isoform X1 [Brassica napus]